MDDSLLTPTRLRFLLGLVIGLSAGLAYGWLLNPVEFVDTTPDTLRRDYRADYVLMIAEAYAQEEDLSQASRRLAALGPQSPLTIVERALDYAESQQFAGPDLRHLERLQTALDRRGTTPEIGGP